MDANEYCLIGDDIAEFSDALTLRSPVGNEAVKAHEKALLVNASVMMLDGELYLVGSKARKELRRWIRVVELAIVDTERGKRFVWAVRVNDPSAMKALAAIRKDASFVVWSKEKRRYSTTKSAEDFSLGQYPPESVESLLLAAFGDRRIDDPNDPRIAELIKSKPTPEEG